MIHFLFVDYMPRTRTADFICVLVTSQLLYYQRNGRGVADSVLGFMELVTVCGGPT